MTIPTDEQLMAWADGELDEQTSTSVAEAVANSPELAAKVEIYRATGRILGDTIARGLPPTSDDELASSTLAHPLPSKPPHAKPSRAASVGATNGAGKAANGLGNGNGHASNIIGVIGSERAPDRTNGNGNATTGTASNGNGTVVRFPGPKAKRDRDTGTPRSGWMPKSTHAAGMAALVVGALAMTLVDWHRSSPTAPQRTTVAGRSSSDSEGAIGEHSTIIDAKMGRADGMQRVPKFRYPAQAVQQTSHRARNALPLPRFDNRCGTQRQQTHQGTNLEPRSTAVGEPQEVVVKTVFVVPHAVLSRTVYGRGNVVELLHELHDHVLVNRIVGSEFDGEFRHVLAKQSHPSRAVRLLQVAAGGERRTAIEDANVVEAEKAPFKDVLAEAVLAIGPPSEIQH